MSSLNYGSIMRYILKKKQILLFFYLSIVFGCIIASSILRYYHAPLSLYEREYSFGDKFYVNEINKEKINSLFKLLYLKENKFNAILDDLGLVLFKNLIYSKQQATTSNSKNKNNVYKQFKYEIDNYLTNTNQTNGANNIGVNDKFIDHLNHVSYYQSFANDRTLTNSSIKTQNNIQDFVIVTASNARYYGALQAAIYYIHKYFPDNRLIVYDLGLTDDMILKTIKNCKCDLRRLNKSYIKEYPHLGEPKKYAWKPIIIQEVLKEYETVLYMDTSIRFNSNNNINSLIDITKSTGMLIQIIRFQLICYTSEDMFKWFNGTIEEYDLYKSLEANFMLFHRNFINSLIMKAWVTCALDENCIAPKNSRLWPCCGCHRFDQDAISIISTYFYAYPIAKLSNHIQAAHVLRKHEYFFDIKRRVSMNYFE